MEKAEQWRPIPGFGGWYELSRHGEIRSMCARKIKNAWIAEVVGSGY